MVTFRVPASELRWRCPESAVEGDSGPSDPLRTVRAALTARLEYALEVRDWRGAHVFVRGPATGARTALVESTLEALDAPVLPAFDYCFLHNFDDPNRPRLVSLPAGQGPELRSALGQVGRFIRDELDAALDARPIRNRLQAIDDRVGADMDRQSASIVEKLKPHGLVLVREETGQIVRLTVHVKQTGRVITQDDFANLVAKGQVSREEFDQIRGLVQELQPEIRELTSAVNKSWARARELRARLLGAETRRLMLKLAEPLLEAFDDDAVGQHLDAIIADVLATRVDRPAPPAVDPEWLYGANVVAQNSTNSLGITYESVPSRRNLAGIIDPAGPDRAGGHAPFQGIRAGSLIAAGTGFLVVDAEDLLTRPHSISLLRNALYHRTLVIQSPADRAAPAVSLRPDPIPLRCRLIVVGTAAQWHRLARNHSDFAELFAEPVDLPGRIARDKAGVGWLAGELRQRCKAEGLAAPDPGALAALIEIAARRGGPGRLDADPWRLMPILRRAAANAPDESTASVTADDVGRILAGLDASPTETAPPFRFPARQEQPGRTHACVLAHEGGRYRAALVQLRAHVAPGDGFGIEFDGVGTEPSVQRAAERLAVLLPRLLRLERPLSLRAVIEIVGAPDSWPTVAIDSLTLAAGIALLGEISNTALRQNLALIGRLQADARIGPIEGINECVEAAWHASGGDHGGPSVVVPSHQRDALMLDPALVQASENDLVRVIALGNLDQALELAAGSAPGGWRNGGFPGDSLYGRARARLTDDVSD